MHLLKPWLFISLFYLLGNSAASQTQPYRENGRWGIRQDEQVIVPPVYDTLFNFDSTGAVCLACVKNRAVSASKFIRVSTTSFQCRYLSKQNQALSISVPGNDTCSIFGFNRGTVKNFNHNAPQFIVSVKGKKYLVNKNFIQLSRKGYDDLKFSEDPLLFYAGMLTEAEEMAWGIVTEKDTMIIQPRYTHLKLNRRDSLIIGCSAGLPNREDDVFDLRGKKIQGYRRHIDQATRKYIIHKIFEPTEYYILNNLETQEETRLNVNEIQSGPDQSEILLRIKNNWYLYNINSHQKKPFKQS